MYATHGYFGRDAFGVALDWFTHILLAAGLAWALRRDRGVALAAAFGAMAPDLDALLAPVTILAPKLWFLDHRTISHSVITGLPWALGWTWVLQRPSVLAVWRRLFRLDISLKLDRRVLAPMYAGVLLHIATDILTVQGPALLAPLSPQRFQADWFYYVDAAPLALSAPLIALFLWQRGSPSQRRAVLAGLLVALAATGGWRAATLDSLPPADHAIPTWNPQDWWTWEALPNGSVEVRLESARRAGPVFTATFPLLRVSGSAGELMGTRALAEATLDYTAYAMNSYLVALNASRDPGGTWRLAYFDPVRRAQALHTGAENAFSPADLILSVAPDGTVTAVWP